MCLCFYKKAAEHRDLAVKALNCAWGEDRRLLQNVMSWNDSGGQEGNGFQCRGTE